MNNGERFNVETLDRIACLWASILLGLTVGKEPWVTVAWGQGTKADYERAAALRRGGGPTIFRDTVSPQWIDADHFWYRVAIGRQQHEFVLVSAAKGERRLLIDHARLAKLLSEKLGRAVDAKALPLGNLSVELAPLRLSFQADQKAWSFEGDTGALREVGGTPPLAKTLTPIDHLPAATVATGEETAIIFVNELPETVRIFWRDREGKRVAYARIASGEEYRQHTYVGHVWEVIDGQERSLGGVVATAAPARAVIAAGRANSPEKSTTDRSNEKASPPENEPPGPSPPPSLCFYPPLPHSPPPSPSAPLTHYPPLSDCPSRTQRLSPSLPQIPTTSPSLCDTDRSGFGSDKSTAYCDPIHDLFAIEPANELPFPYQATEPTGNSNDRRTEVSDPRRSPDGQWLVRIRDFNVTLERTVRASQGSKTPGDKPQGNETQDEEARDSAEREFSLTRDGTRDDPYGGRVYWSPDSQHFVVMQTRNPDRRTVYLVESSPTDQLQPKLHSFEYLKPGDRIAHPRPRLFSVATKRQTPIDEQLFAQPWSVSDLRWSGDSRRFTFLYNQRGHQVLRLIAVDPLGQVTCLIDETSPTFIDYAYKRYLHWLDRSQEILWMSERDGWNHLWLYDSNQGKVKRAVTSGPWLVRQVLRVDEEKRQVWFMAGGVRPEQDPYYLHLCRASLDGGELQILTEGDGTHEITFSPDRQWFLDKWSRVDQPPVIELRRAEDGQRMCVLEHADHRLLMASGWTAPERFSAKGRDGETDIYGVIFRPTQFEASRSYPVVEQIYAGPQGSFVPKAFGRHIGQQAMAELGFIVVQIDGMGTNWRSKRFHDVCWRNLADAGYPDRILWIKAAAATRPWMDLERVGVYGGSAGGQNAMRALLDHYPFYKVAVADCGCHDNRMDKIWWNELWMGYPVGAHYEQSSNVTHAHKLRGKLLLIVGELDRNVDPASTMQVVNALQQANKDYELVIVTGAGHGAAETPYGARRRSDFLVRHLHGTEPRSP